jgi:hypothetical protein
MPRCHSLDSSKRSPNFPERASGRCGSMNVPSYLSACTAGWSVYSLLSPTCIFPIIWGGLKIKKRVNFETC